MAEKKKQYPTITSPVGVARFAHLAKPDSEGKYADGKYKVTLVLDKADPANVAFATKINAMHDEVGGDESKAPVKDGSALNAKRVKRKKEAKPEDEGKLIVTMKSQFPPQLLGAGNVVLDVAPRSGDKIKLAFAAVPYESGDGSGVSMQLRAVKLIERRAGPDYSDAFADDEDETGEPTGDETPSTGGKTGQGDGDF